MSPLNHRPSKAFARVIVCVLTALAVATSACTSLYPVPAVRTLAGQPGWQVNAGETIHVTLKDGTSETFRVYSVTPEHIISADHRQFEQASIVSVERRQSDGSKTTALIVVTALVLVVGGASAASSLTAGIPGGRRAPNE